MNGRHEMRIIDARNPRYLNADKTAIAIEAKLDHTVAMGLDFIPFVARPDDVEQHGRALFDLAKNGHYGEVAPYDPDWKDH